MTTLAAMETLTAPDGVIMPGTPPIKWSSHLILQYLVATLFGTDHPATLVLEEFGREMKNREMELEYYPPPRIGGSIPISLTYLVGWSRSAYLNELSRSG